jgi:hypothetical protein
MNPIILKNRTASGDLLEATFLPEMGMNMISYKRGSTEVIDQSTRVIFEERYAGLGALIGPHFHHRLARILPIIKDESLFPHIARVRAKGTQDPFSHGIGRYAPWKAEYTETKVTAVLSSKDTWNGVPLSDLEGYQFKMTFSAELTAEGLKIALSVVSDIASLVGIHYYYHLPDRTGVITTQIQDKYIEKNEIKPIPKTWNYDSQHTLRYQLAEAADYTFFPYPNPLEGKILLETGHYSLLTTYRCHAQENSWQLYHPADASFVCIEPLSAQDPRHPNLTVSSLQIQLQIC